MSDPICGQTTCDDFAEVVAHWPGQPISLCAPHLAAACVIAEAMGFDLRYEPLPEATTRLRSMLRSLAAQLDVDLDQIERFANLELE